jgi:hypothetical protein
LLPPDFVIVLTTAPPARPNSASYVSMSARYFLHGVGIGYLKALARHEMSFCLSSVDEKIVRASTGAVHREGGGAEPISV